jgi:hypothetical protein
MYDAVVTFVTHDDEGNVITEVFRIKFESNEDFVDGLAAFKTHSLNSLENTLLFDDIDEPTHLTDEH